MLGLPILTGAAAGGGGPPPLDPNIGENWAALGTTPGLFYFIDRDLTNGLWIATTETTAYYSSDAVSWTQATGLSAPYIIYDVKYCGALGTFIVTHYPGGGANNFAEIWRSTNGTAFTRVFQAAIVDDTVGAGAHGIAFDGTTIFVTVRDGSSSSYITASTDGTTWGTSVSFGANQVPHIRSIAYNGSRIIAMTLNFASTRCTYSDNGGSTWTVAANLSSGSYSYTTARGDTFLRGGSDGTFINGAGPATFAYRSTDGLSWAAPVSTVNAYHEAVYISDIDRWIVGTGAAGAFTQYSDDSGVNWTTSPVDPPYEVFGMAYASDLSQVLGMTNRLGATGVYASTN
jgi:hypothetical protein